MPFILLSVAVNLIALPASYEQITSHFCLLCRVCFAQCHAFEGRPSRSIWQLPSFSWGGFHFVTTFCLPSHMWVHTWLTSTCCRVSCCCGCAMEPFEFWKPEWCDPLLNTIKLDGQDCSVDKCLCCWTVQSWRPEWVWYPEHMQRWKQRTDSKVALRPPHTPWHVHTTQ